MSLNRKQILGKMGFWTFVILAGITAYGVGLYQGSIFRIQRTLASLQRPVPVEMVNQASSQLNPPLPAPSSPSNSPSNTQNQKSHSKSH